MGMVFCRGCGKEIHESATNCPLCGAVQKIQSPGLGDTNLPSWASVTSFVCGIVSILLAMTEPEGTWDSDAVVGGLIFGGVTVVFGVVSLLGRQAKQWMAITGVVLGVLMLLVSISSI